MSCQTDSRRIYPADSALAGKSPERKSNCTYNRGSETGIRERVAKALDEKKAMSKSAKVI